MKKGKINSNQTNIFVSGHLRRQLARGLRFSTLPQVKMLQQCNLETSSNFHTFLFQVDQMAPGLAWQKIPMILSLYLPILKQKSTWAHPAGRVPGLHSGSPAAAMLVWESWGQQLQGLSQPRQEPAQACCCPWQPGMSFSNTLHPLTRSFSSWVFLPSGKNTFCWPVSILGIHLPQALLECSQTGPQSFLGQHCFQTSWQRKAYPLTSPSQAGWTRGLAWWKSQRLRRPRSCSSCWNRQRASRRTRTCHALCLIALAAQPLACKDGSPPVLMLLPKRGKNQAPTALSR